MERSLLSGIRRRFIIGAGWLGPAHIAQVGAGDGPVPRMLIWCALMGDWKVYSAWVKHQPINGQPISPHSGASAPAQVGGRWYNILIDTRTGSHPTERTTSLGGLHASGTRIQLVRQVGRRPAQSSFGPKQRCLYLRWLVCFYPEPTPGRPLPLPRAGRRQPGWDHSLRFQF